MAIKIVKVKEAIEDNGIKILAHAPAGCGKTVLAATACEPTLIISAESGLLSLNNDELKEQNPHFMPELCDVVEIETLDDLQEVYELLESQVDEPQWKWVSLDSITEIAEKVLSDELEENKDPRKAYGNLSNRMGQLLRMFRDLPNYNIYMSAKQTPIKDEYSGLTIYSPMMPGAKLGNSIPYLFDEVLCLRVLQDEEDGSDYRVLQTQRDIQFEAKDRSGKLEKFEAPSLKRIAEKIRGTYEESEEVEETKETAVEETSKKEVDQADASESVKGDAPLKRKEYYWHNESDSGVVVETESQRENALDNDCEKITKAEMEKREKAIEEASKKPEVAEQVKEVDAEKEEFAETLKTLDKQDLAALAIKLDEDIEQEVADEAEVDTLVDWIIESSMEDIKEAAQEIGLA